MRVREKPNNFIDDVLAKVNIVELINETTPLQKKGKNHMGLCPFHHEKTPSFSVSETEQLYYCFSCKAAGNAITFVKETQNLTSSEAIRTLAERAGVAIPDQGAPQKNQKYYDINEEAATFFKVMLTHTKEGQNALDYLHNRKISNELIRTFDLGLAPNGRDQLFQALKQKSYLQSDMSDLGLVKEKDHVYDVFRNRIMFPIHDEKGRAIGFSGRLYEGEQNVAKYMNTQNTPVFTKSKVLYNLHRAEGAIKAKRRIVLFEGFMDVIKAHAAGVEEGIASMGTALTEAHLRMLKRYSRKVVLCFDGDQAGQDAARTYIDLLSKADFDVYIVSLEKGLDPDDYIETYGAEAFRALIDRAQNEIDYLYDITLKQTDLKQYAEVEQFKKFIFKRIAPRDRGTQEGYLQRLSDDLGVRMSTIEQDFAEIIRKARPTYKKPVKMNITDKFKKAERSLIHYFLRDPIYEKRFRRDLKDALFTDKNARDIQLEIFETYRLSETALCIVPEVFKTHLTEAQRAYFDKHIDVKNYPFHQEEFEDLIRVMHEQNRREHERKLRSQLDDALTTEEKVRIKKLIDQLRGKYNGKRKNHSGIN